MFRILLLENVVIYAQVLEIVIGREYTMSSYSLLFESILIVRLFMLTYKLRTKGRKLE